MNRFWSNQMIYARKTKLLASNDLPAISQWLFPEYDFASMSQNGSRRSSWSACWTRERGANALVAWPLRAEGSGRLR